MCGRGREFVTPDESTVVTKSLLDPVVVEDGQGDRGLPDSARTNEGDWSKPLGEIDYLLDQLVTSEEGPWGQRWRFSRYARFGCETIGPLVAEIADLV